MKEVRESLFGDREKVCRKCKKRFIAAPEHRYRDDKEAVKNDQGAT